MSSARVVCVLALAVSLGGCVRAVSMRGDHWYAVQTQHVRLTTDVDHDRAVREARRLETMQRGLASAFYHCADHDRAQVDVTILDRDAEMAALFPGRSAVSLHAEDDLVALPRHVVLEAGALGDTGGDQLAMHELAHQMIDACFPGAPPWLHEGLATVFETVEVDHTTVRFGFQSRRATEMPETYLEISDGVVVRYSPRQLFPISALDVMHLGYDDFVAPAPRWGIPSEQIGAANYAAATQLATLLALGPFVNVRSAFLAYLQFLREGVDRDVAYTRAFAGLDVNQSFQWFLRHPHFPALTRPLADASEIRVEEREMSPADAQMQLAAIAVRSDATQALGEARDHVALASRQSSLRARAILFAAMLDTKTHPRAAIALAAAIAPDDLDVIRAQALLAMDDGDVLAIAALRPRLAGRTDLRESDEVVLAALERAVGLEDQAHARAIAVLRADRGAWGAWSVIAHESLDRGDRVLAARIDQRLHTLSQHEGSEDMQAAIRELDEGLSLVP